MSDLEKAIDAEAGESKSTLNVAAMLVWAVVMLAIVICVTLFGGCASRGVKVVASTASATNLGDINWEEYKIPVFSIISGPRTTVWINKDYLALRKVHAGGCTTNDTNALGIYTDRGGRTNFVDLEFRDVSTNKVYLAHGAVD